MPFLMMLNCPIVTQDLSSVSSLHPVYSWSPLTISYHCTSDSWTVRKITEYGTHQDELDSFSLVT